MAAALALAGAAACATLQQLAALRQVDFDLAGVGRARLAGVDLSRVRSYQDLGPADLGRIGLAVAGGDLPLEMTLDVRASNPADNRVTAKLTRLRWSLYLQDRETINGSVDQAVELPPGQPTLVPVVMRLDLMDFFSGSAQSLVNIALAVLGQEAPATTISLRAVPSIDTPLGPIEYPSPITIARRTVGGGGR